MAIPLHIFSRHTEKSSSERPQASLGRGGLTTKQVDSVSSSGKASEKSRISVQGEKPKEGTGLRLQEEI